MLTLYFAMRDDNALPSELAKERIKYTKLWMPVQQYSDIFILLDEIYNLRAKCNFFKRSINSRLSKNRSVRYQYNVVKEILKPRCSFLKSPYKSLIQISYESSCFTPELTTEQSVYKSLI